MDIKGDKGTRSILIFCLVKGFDLKGGHNNIHYKFMSGAKIKIVASLFMATLSKFSILLMRSSLSAKLIKKFYRRLVELGIGMKIPCKDVFTGWLY
jgi:hypothetical protein